MSGRLEGKVAIVTGAGTGIGEAIAHKFAKEGARVVVNGLPDDPIDDVVKAMKQRGGQTQDYPLDDFDETIRMNIRSAFLMTKFALPHLHKSRGNIVSAGSESGMIGLANNTPYGGTKAWMHSFMRGVAHEQAKHGIRANCVASGPIDTAWTHKETGPMDAKMEKNAVAATPLGRRGTPEEVANVYAFLASDEASYVTGALYTVDGGVTIGKGAVGDEVPKSLRKPPEMQLHLEHSMDGNLNKDTHRVK